MVASADALLEVFTLLQQAALLAVAAYLLTLDGDKRALRLLSAALAAMAVQQLGVLGRFFPDLVIRAPAFLDGVPPFLVVYTVARHVFNGLVVLFAASYPQRIRWRSVEGVVFAFFLALVVVGLVADVGFRASQRLALDLDSTTMALVPLAASLLAALRAPPGPAGRPALFVLASLSAVAFYLLGHAIPQVVLRAVGVELAAEFRVRPGWWTEAGFENPIREGAALVVAAYFAKRGVKLPVVLVGLGAAWLALYQIRPAGLVNLPLVFMAVAPAYAVHRHGAFGVTSETPRSAWLLASAFGTTALLLCVTVANAFLPGSATAIALAAVLGAGVALVVVVQLRPRSAQALTFTVDFTRGVTIAGTPSPPADVPHLAPGALVRGRYRVERLLGEGGHGAAYLARDEKLARDVVLKAVRSADGRALREARAASALDHPNLVRVIDLIEGASESVIVLEFVDGGNLRARLARGPLSSREAVTVVADVLAGLEAAHASGLAHNDVKPENVLLTRAGRAKLADFGIAREAARGSTALTRGGAGTLAYMSPERVRGGPGSVAGDLYSVGVLLHEMLATRHPLGIERLDDFEARSRVLAGEVAIAPAAERYASVIRKALSRDPGARFASAEEMQAAVLAVA